MSKCKKQSGGVNNQIREKIEKYLDRLRFAYPGTKFSIVLSGKNEVIAESAEEEEHLVEDMKVLLPSLTQSAEQFASIIGQSSCSVIHILGSAHIFSSFIIDDNLTMLVFFSEMNHHAIMQHNTVAADRKMVEDVIIPLKRELENLLINENEETA